MHPTVPSKVNQHETKAAVANGHQNHRIEMLVVVVQRARIRWAIDSDVLAINRANAVRETAPATIEKLKQQHQTKCNLNLM